VGNGAEPIGDAMHSPKVKRVTTKADPNGNRAERRLAKKLGNQATKKSGK
jgi:hypothetical protein